MINETNYEQILKDVNNRKKIPMVIHQIPMGDVIFELTDQGLSDQECDYLQIAFEIHVRNEISANDRFHKIIEENEKLSFLKIYENRIYLLDPGKNHLGNTIKERTPWLTYPAQAAACIFENLKMTTGPGGHKAGTISPRVWVKLLFAKNFQTKQETFEHNTFKVSTGALTVGSAFSMSLNGRIVMVTASHVAGKLHGSGFVESKMGIFSVTPRHHRDRDVAILELDNSVESGLECGSTKFTQIEDKIYCAGYPSVTDTLTVSVGHVSQVNSEYDGLAGLIQISGAAINPNNSGGPVTDSELNVIGVLTLRANESGTQNISFVEPIEHIFDIFD